MSFSQPNLPRQDIVVRTTYLIDTGVDPFRILVYLAHQDIMGVLRNRGILAS